VPRTIYDEVIVRIKPLCEQIQVETRKKGVMSVKNIALQDLIDSLSKSIKESKVISSGFLPENCLSIQVSDDLKSIVLWHPLQHCDYTLFKTTYENFPIPRMVFGFDIDTSGKVKGHRMAIADDERPTVATRLYEYPFSNVYDNTSICIGAANNLPVYEKLPSLASLPNLILSIPNNDHNFKRANNRLHLDYRELLDHLQDKDSAYYYEKVLVPRKDGKTLQDFINYSA